MGKSLARRLETATFFPSMKRTAALLLLLCSLTLLPAQDAAQATLPITTLTINTIQVAAEVADEPEERTIGLMHRDGLAKNSGMLFVMPRAERAAFWMRNTKIPLSIAYINASGMIVEIHSLKPLDETPVPSKFPAIAYALEMEDGWFDKNGVYPGDRIGGLPAPPR